MKEVSSWVVVPGVTRMNACSIASSGLAIHEHKDAGETFAVILILSICVKWNSQSSAALDRNVLTCCANLRTIYRSERPSLMWDKRVLQIVACASCNFTVFSPRNMNFSDARGSGGQCTVCTRELRQFVAAGGMRPGCREVSLTIATPRGSMHLYVGALVRPECPTSSQVSRTHALIKICDTFVANSRMLPTWAARMLKAAQIMHHFSLVCSKY